MYFTYEDITIYYIGDKSKIDEMKSGRQQQVVNLIRQLLLKRFESSVEAFAETCIRIYARLRKFITDYKDQGNQKHLDRFLNKQEIISDFVDSTIIPIDTSDKYSIIIPSISGNINFAILPILSSSMLFITEIL